MPTLATEISATTVYSLKVLVPMKWKMVLPGEVLEMHTESNVKLTIFNLALYHIYTHIYIYIQHTYTIDRQLSNILVHFRGS